MVVSRSVVTGARVKRALKAVYDQFAADPPQIIEGCPCCLEKRGVDVLLTNPLRQISGQQLWSYVSGLFYTVGSDDDFKYLLPRIFDIAINDPGNSNDPEIVLAKLDLSHWKLWSAAQRKAIEELVDTWFELALSRDLENAEDGCIGNEAESVLCGGARAGFSLHNWLSRIRDPDAAPILRDLKDRSPDELSAFWEFAPEGLKDLSRLISERKA